MSKIIVKISFLLFLLNPNLSWGKNYITCIGERDNEFLANIYNFEINKSELKKTKSYLAGAYSDANFYYIDEEETIREFTIIEDNTLFDYTILYKQDELSEYIERFQLDTLSGFMILRTAYIDKETGKAFVYDYDDNKVFDDEKDFMRFMEKSYYECKKVKPLFE